MKMAHLCIVNVSEVIIISIYLKKKGPKLGKKVYPVISYQYDTSATLTEIAKEISSNSGVSEGETISVLKDFRTLLRKTLLAGR